MKQILKVFSSFVLCVSCGCTSAAKSHETLSENDPTPVYRGMPSGSNDLIYTLSPVVCYDGYDESLDEILEHTDAVIYGEVTDFVFSEVSVEISTFLTVHVNEVLYGDLFGVSEVRIFKSGGYIPASEYFSIFNLNDGLKDRFVEFRFETALRICSKRTFANANIFDILGYVPLAIVSGSFRQFRFGFCPSGLADGKEERR